MKRISIIFLAALMGGSVMAQDTYDAANFAGSDLNGTARYVGMGGALSALGGDLTVMGTNPAGIGLFRHNEASFGASAIFTDEKGQLGHDATRASIDHAGVVFALDQDNRGNSGLQYVNFGINYVKKRNHLGNALVNVQNLEGVFSQSYQISDMVSQNYDAFGTNYDSWGMLGYMGEPIVTFHDDDGNFLEYTGTPAASALYKRATYGSTSQADFNVSFNVSDKFFYGITLGVYDLNYRRESFYQEIGMDGTPYDFSNWYETDGEGFDLKFGFICRPIDDSPFRFGLAVHTPTWYNLEDVNGSVAYLDDEPTADPERTDPYEYAYRTPWKFGVSLGHTIDRNFAIGAEYEYTDYSFAKYDSRDWDNDPYFYNINEYTKDALRPVHTFKIGCEYKPIDNFAIRLGYNYVSSPYKNEAYRIIAYDSPFTETDYTNWKGINRLTVGLGWRWNGGYFDLAYQLQTQKGDFYAFDDIDLRPTVIHNDRSQILATLGFSF